MYMVQFGSEISIAKRMALASGLVNETVPSILCLKVMSVSRLSHTAPIVTIGSYSGPSLCRELSV